MGWNIIWKVVSEEFMNAEVEAYPILYLVPNYLLKASNKDIRSYVKFIRSCFSSIFFDFEM